MSRVLCRMHYLMGCLISVEVRAHSRAQAVEAVEAAFGEMKRVERLLSKFIPGSAVDEINRHGAKHPVALSDEVFDLMVLARRYAELSEGFFDITVAPLIELWNRAERLDRLPGKDEMRETLSKVGASLLELDPVRRSLFLKRTGMAVDLGALGKGYGVDRAAGVLRQMGIEEAVISTGSTIYSLGADPRKFGIENPLDGTQITAALWLRNQAVSTSGQSERYWTVRGRRFGHLLNPQSGYPAGEGLLCASAIAETALLSEVFSTAAFSGRILHNRGHVRTILRYGGCGESGEDALDSFAETCPA